MNTRQIDILDLMLILVKRKKFIIISLLIISILVVTYSLVIEQRWTSRTTFKPTINSGAGIDMFGSLMSGNMGSLFVGSNGNDEILDIMNSRTFLEKIIEKFDLVTYFEIEDEDPYVIKERVLRSFKENILSLDRDIETNIFSLEITTKDRKLSADIANFMVKELEDYLQNVRMTKGKEEKQFLDKRIIEINEEINKYSAELSRFKEEHKILELEAQISPTLISYTDFVAQYLEEDIKLELAQNFLKNDSSKKQMVEFKRNEILKKIKQLETGDNSIINYQIPLDSIPNLSQKYKLIMINLSIQEKVLETLYPQYELAKLQELRDTPTVNIIDKAIPAGLRSWPKRGFMCVVVFLISAFALSFYVIAIELWKQKINNDEKLKIRYEHFKSQLWKK